MAHLILNMTTGKFDAKCTECDWKYSDPSISKVKNKVKEHYREHENMTDYQEKYESEKKRADNCEVELLRQMKKNTELAGLLREFQKGNKDKKTLKYQKLEKLDEQDAKYHNHTIWRATATNGCHILAVNVKKNDSQYVQHWAGNRWEVVYDRWTEPFDYGEGKEYSLETVQQLLIKKALMILGG